MTQYYVATDAVGGSGGTTFDFRRDTPTPITSINVWSNSAAVLAIQVAFADGTLQTTGTPRSTMATMSFDPGEQITSLTMMKTDGSTTDGYQCVGQISIGTNKGKYQVMGPGGSSSSSIGVGSGLFVGIGGNSGDAIDRLFFYCLRQSIKSIDVSIPASTWTAYNDTSTGIAQKVLASQTFIAPSSASLNWTFSGTLTESNTYSFTQTATQKWGISVTISGDFLGIGASTTGTWDTENQKSQESSQTEEISIGSTISGTLDKSTYTTASTTCSVGKVNVSYTATVTITFTDNKSCTYEENGIYNNVTYFDGKTTFTNPTTVGSQAAYVIADTDIVNAAHVTKHNVKSLVAAAAA